MDGRADKRIDKQINGQTANLLDGSNWITKAGSFTKEEKKDIGKVRHFNDMKRYKALWPGFLRGICGSWVSWDFLWNADKTIKSDSMPRSSRYLNRHRRRHRCPQPTPSTATASLCRSMSPRQPPSPAALVKQPKYAALPFSINVCSAS